MSPHPAPVQKGRWFSAVWLMALALAASGALLHFCLGRYSDFSSGHVLGSDDAFISWRYAQNLLQGHGLVFNPGEYVEGYSNLLFTLMVAPALLAGKNFAYPFAMLLNVVLLGILLGIYHRWCRQQLGDGLAHVAVLLLALNPWLWINTGTGLETVLVMTITVAAWVAVERCCDEGCNRPGMALGLCAVLSILSRVDGFLLPLACALYLLLRGRRAAALRLGALVVAVMAAYTAVRLYYYGDVIANTYYNKISGDLLWRLGNGLHFYWRNATQLALWLALLCGAVQLVRQRRLDFAFFFLVLWSLYMIYIGDDLYFERFFMALVPLCIFIVLKAMRHAPRTIIGAACLLLLAVPFFFYLKDPRLDRQTGQYDFWEETGKFLAREYPNATLAVDACGKIPFFSGLPTIDMLGLNDRHIGKMTPQIQYMPGHTKYDPGYVLSRQPTFIMAWSFAPRQLAWGLEPQMYQPDYELKYIVNITRASMGQANILDVTGMAEDQLAALVGSTHSYGILMRRDAMGPSSSPAK